MTIVEHGWHVLFQPAGQEPQPILIPVVPREDETITVGGQEYVVVRVHYDYDTRTIHLSAAERV